MSRRSSLFSLHHRAGRARGFTLVELLVVIGIIALLISILMPALNRARRLAMRTQCLAQMRQLGTSLAIYISESKGWTPIQPLDRDSFAEPTMLDSTDPNARSLLGTLLTYMNLERRVLACPMATEEPWTPWGVPTALSKTNYMVNQSVTGKPITKVKRSSQIIIIQEDRYLWNIAWQRPYKNGSANGKPTYTAWAFYNDPPYGQEYSYHHEKGGNFLFADGHAEWRLSSMLRPPDYGFTGGAGVNGTDDDVSTMPVHFGITYYSILDN